jgi:hypothetical protein
MPSWRGAHLETKEAQGQLYLTKLAYRIYKTSLRTVGGIEANLH